MSNLTNFTGIFSNGFSFNGTASPVSGLPGTFGGADLLGIAGLIIIIAIGIKMRVPFDLLAVTTATMFSILAGVYLPEWSWLLFLIVCGAIFGMGLLRVFKNR